MAVHIHVETHMRTLEILLLQAKTPMDMSAHKDLL